jgi:hypothetical protein
MRANHSFQPTRYSALRALALAAELVRLASMGGSVPNFVPGNTKNTQIGAVNRNGQKCLGHRGRDGNDHGQKAYKMECQNANCLAVYGVNGTDAFQRKCPYCQGGKPGIDF